MADHFVLVRESCNGGGLHLRRGLQAWWQTASHISSPRNWKIRFGFMISLDNIRHYVQDAFITGPLQQNLDGLQIIGPSGELQDSEPIFMLHVDIFDWLG